MEILIDLLHCAWVDEMRKLIFEALLPLLTHPDCRRDFLAAAGVPQIVHIISAATPAAATATNDAHLGENMNRHNVAAASQPMLFGEIEAAASEPAGDLSAEVADALHGGFKSDKLHAEVAEEAVMDVPAAMQAFAALQKMMEEPKTQAVLK